MIPESLASIDFKTSYRKSIHNIANDFYIPAMRTALLYRRAVGYFSSAIFSLSMDALEELIENNGKIQIVTSPFLSTSDIEQINEALFSIENNEEIVTATLIGSVESISKKSVNIDPLKILSTLILNGTIEIKIAILPGRGILHDKMGIFTDKENNHVVFKGSMNESLNGLASIENDGHLDSADVFCSWKPNDAGRVADQIGYFNNLWSNNEPKCRIITLKQAVLEKVFKEYEIAGEKNLIESINRLRKTNSEIQPIQQPKIDTLFAHQEEAIEIWEKNGRRGILAHATASGKTITGLRIIADSLERKETPIVIVPSTLLQSMWDTEIRKELAHLNISIQLLGGEGDDTWKKEGWLKRNSKDQRGFSDSELIRWIFIVVSKSAAGDHFQNYLSQGEHLLLVADECHNYGSHGAVDTILKLKVGPRIGLSATPARKGDEDGTEKLFEYLGGVIHEFTIGQAIKMGRLCTYIYKYKTCELDQEEVESFKELTHEMKQYYARFKSSSGESKNTYYEKYRRLVDQRANIPKLAKSKIDICRDIIQREYKDGEHWIIFCQNGEQLHELNIQLSKISEYQVHVITSESRKYSDHDLGLELFQTHGGIILCINILDEGVNIPEASHAIIMASTTNERQWVQRRGRLLRKHPKKHMAYIWDIVCLPPKSLMDDDLAGMVKGEIRRVTEYASDAYNNLNVRLQIKETCITMDLDIGELDGETV